MRLGGQECCSPCLQGQPSFFRCGCEHDAALSALRMEDSFGGVLLTFLAAGHGSCAAGAEWTAGGPARAASSTRAASDGRRENSRASA